MVFIAISALLVIYSFLMLGCSRGLISDLDKQEIRHQLNMGTLENKIVQLKNKNSEHIMEIKKLKENVSQFTTEISELKTSVSQFTTEISAYKKKTMDLENNSSNKDIPSSPRRYTFGIDRKLVGDKLPDFRNDISWKLSSGPFLYMRKSSISKRWLSDTIALQKYQIIYIEGATVDGQRFNPYIRFKKKGTWIELKNGTRYICANSGECEVINFTITKGIIEVHHNKSEN